MASRTQFECNQDIHFDFNDLMDAGFPREIRSYIGNVFQKIFNAVRKPVEKIVEQVRYNFKRKQFDEFMETVDYL